jgi:aquaporin TIP
MLRAMPGDYLRRGFAEFVGAFALIFIGAGSLIYGNIVGSALAHGLVIAVMASAVGHISGGHFNPAITFGFVVTRRITLPLAGVYWISQLAGAVLAALLLKWALPGTILTNVGAPAIDPSIENGEAVVIEAVLTFFLVWVVFATAVDPRGAFKQISGLAIGFTIAAGVLMAGAVTGGAMNPARAVGPMLAGNHWDDWWVWLLGPIGGATIAAVLYEALYLRTVRPAPVGTAESGVQESAAGTAALD